MVTLNTKYLGPSAITSGIVGIVAYVSLMTAVITRDSIELTPAIKLLFRIHDFGIIMQYLFFIPTVIELKRLSDSINRNPINAGVVTIIVLIVSLLLVFPEILNDSVYMIPQGFLGIWLIKVLSNSSIKLSKLIRFFGVFVGTGLMLVGLFPLGYAIFVDASAIFSIPAIEPKTYPPTTANEIVHIILSIGSLMGVLTLPLWTITFGIMKLKESNRIYNGLA